MTRLLYGIFVSGLFLVTLPLQMIVGVMVAWSSGFPVLFRQQRTGRFGKSFTIYKFRTMHPGAESEKQQYRLRNESSGPVFKIHNDPRFTPIGKVLSHTGLDELPQLWNVVRGEMALIGPRPLPLDEDAKLSAWMRERYDVLPGIISPAIVSGSYHKDFAGWMKSDISYVRTKHVWKDMWLMWAFAGFVAYLLVKETIRCIRRK